MTVLAVYLVLVFGASWLGGSIPRLVPLTHSRLQLAVSFVAGLMLGVALLHLLPHAALLAGRGRLDSLVLWMLGGVLAMFLLERFFCFHHHDAPDGAAPDHVHGAACGHEHVAGDHQLTWAGAAVGLTLHSLIDGVALAASVRAAEHHGWLAGLSTFLVVFCHKPFDAMTITTLMAHGRYGPSWQSRINLLFALVTPAGALLFYFGAGGEEMAAALLPPALAFSAGTFLCVSLSDLLPELQFHQHDRVKLTLAMLAGLTIAWTIGLAEGADHGMGPHGHDHEHHEHEEAMGHRSQATRDGADEVHAKPRPYSGYSRRERGVRSARFRRPT